MTTAANPCDGDLLTVASIAAQGDAVWASKALSALKVLARLGREFTVYEVTLDPFKVAEPPNPNYWGSLTAAAKAAGLIRVAGYLPSPRPSRNGGVCRSWIGMPVTHRPRMVEGSIVPVEYAQIQGDLEVATCECGEPLYRGLDTVWSHSAVAA